MQPPDQYLGRVHALGLTMGPPPSQELWEEVKTGNQILPFLVTLKVGMFPIEKI